MAKSKPGHRQKSVPPVQTPQPKHQSWVKHHTKRNAAITVAVVAVLIAIIVFASLPHPSVNVGQKAPDFSLPVVNGSGVFHLSDQIGKPVFIEFMRTQCEYCQAQAPILQQAFGSYGGRVVFVSITIDPNYDQPNTLVAFATAHNSMGTQSQPWHWLRDDLANPASYQYGVNGTPTMFLVDSNGMVQAKLLGLTQMTDLQTAFQKIT